MVRLFVSRPIASLMLVSALLLLGLLGMFRLRITLFPELQVPEIYILTRFSGMAPSQVEQMVTIPLEQATGSVRGVTGIESRSERGLSVIKVSFAWGSDRDLAMVQLRQKLDQSYATLPERASRSILIPFDPTRHPVMVLHLRDKDRGKRLRFFAESVIRPELEQVRGIAAVEIRGGWRRQINVLLDAPDLYGHGLDVRSVAQALKNHNITAPVGTIKQGDYEKTVRIDARARQVHNLRSVPIGPGKDRSRVLLSEVGVIEDGYADRRGTTLVQGKPAVILELRKEPEANTLRVARRIRDALLTINTKHGKHATLEILSDNSKLVRHSIDAARRAAVLGSFLAFLLLLVFLSNWTSAIIASLSIPIALTISLGFLQMLDVSLNLMSLSGLALGAGLLIDGSIMVSDSIDAELQRQNHHPRPQERRLALEQSIIVGTNKVYGSLWASTLTTIVVFFPIVFVSGIAAALFQDLAIAVIVALLAGLFCSIVVIPVFSLLVFSHYSPDGSEFRESSIAARPVFQPMIGIISGLRVSARTFLSVLENLYAAMLAWSLRKPTVIIAIVSLASVVGLLLIGTLPRSLMPTMDARAVKAELILSPGTAYHRTASIAASIEKAMKRRGSTRSSVSHIGPESGDMTDELQGRRNQNRASLLFFPKGDSSSKRVAQQVRALLSRDNPLSLEVLQRPGPIQRVLGQVSNQYFLEFGQTANPSLPLRELAKDLSSVPGVLSVDNHRLTERPVLNVRIHRIKAAQSGVSPARIAATMQNSVRGTRASRYRMDGRTLDIRVRLDESHRTSADDLQRLQLQTKGQMLSLESLVQTAEDMSPPVRIRQNQERVQRLRFNVSPNAQERTLAEIRGRVASFLKRSESQVVSQQTSGNKDAGPGLPSAARKASHAPQSADSSNSSARNQNSFEIRAANEEAIESLRGLAGAFALSCILIYQLLAGQFESLLHAVVLLLSIPSLLIGAGLALLLSGSGLNISSGMGIVMLGGIVINASIALFEEMQRLARGHASNDPVNLRRSIVEAGRSRLRPILLTTLTTVGGVAPMAAGLGTGSENQQPLGIAMVGGLLVGTSIALIAFPCFYYLVERRKR
ncbi:MAG: efflux RND transporter permease subunit [Leptospiraceae bacterium]|nr:efflux RND transporter permease subunit [Leptospiraceae bacterium]